MARMLFSTGDLASCPLRGTWCDSSCALLREEFRYVESGKRFDPRMVAKPTGEFTCALSEGRGQKMRKDAEQ